MMITKEIKERKIIVSFSIDAKLFIDLRDLAYDKRMSISSLVNQILSDYLNNVNKLTKNKKEEVK